MLDDSVKKSILYSVVAHLVVIAVIYIGSVFSAEREKVTFKPFIEAKLVGAVPKIDKKVTPKNTRQENEKEKQRQAQLKKERDRQEKLKRQQEQERKVAQEQEQIKKQELQRQQAALDLKKQQEKERLEKEKQEKIEQERVRKEREKQEKLKEEQERKEQERLAKIEEEKKEAARKLAEKKRKEEAERKKKEEAERKRKEEELAALAAAADSELWDSELSDVRQSVALNEVEKIQAQIHQRIYRYWKIPDSIGECKVNFSLGPGGIILEISSAVGSVEYCETGQQAIRDAEPLPYSTNPEVRKYLRDISITFKPVER